MTISQQRNPLFDDISPVATAQFRVLHAAKYLHWEFEAPRGDGVIEVQRRFCEEPTDKLLSPNYQLVKERLVTVKSRLGPLERIGGLYHSYGYQHGSIHGVFLST